jgi:hypothetical protein
MSQLARLFTNPDLPRENFGNRGTVLAACVTAGMPEPNRFYLKMLETPGQELALMNEKGDNIGTRSFEPSVAAEFADEIVNRFAPHDETVKTIVKKYLTAEERVPALKEWLRTRAGKKD